MGGRGRKMRILRPAWATGWHPVSKGNKRKIENLFINNWQRNEAGKYYSEKKNGRWKLREAGTEHEGRPDKEWLHTDVDEWIKHGKSSPASGHTASIKITGGSASFPDDHGIPPASGCTAPIKTTWGFCFFFQIIMESHKTTFQK